MVATLRDTGRAGALRKAAEETGVELDVRQLDVTDERSVATAVDGVIADYGRLDAVINNAGAGHLGTLENESVAEVRTVMEVNFFGVLHVSKAALPHLRAVGGRLITVTSVGGVIGQPFNEAYCAAKFAVEGYMESLAPVAARLGVTVSVVEPGAVATEFVNNIGVDPADEVAASRPVRGRAAGVPGPHRRAVPRQRADPRRGRRRRTGGAHRGPARVPSPDLGLGTRVHRHQAHRPGRLGGAGPHGRLDRLTGGRESAGTHSRLALSSSKSVQKAPRTSSRCSRERAV